MNPGIFRRASPARERWTASVAPMLRARSLVAAIVAALLTAATFATASWATAEAAARGANLAKLPALLTAGSFTALEWPIRTDQPPAAVHVTFYLAVVVIGLVAGLATMVTIRKASPRNGAAAFVGTWFGAIFGAVIAAVIVYWMRVGDLAASAADRNEVLAGLLQQFAFGALVVGWVPALLTWVVFKLANRKRAAEYATALEAADGGAGEENPFDLAPNSNGESRPVEPGFTYPAGDYHDGSYRDVDVASGSTQVTGGDEDFTDERERSRMVFTDPTDATGQDLHERANDYGYRRPAEQSDESPELRKTGS